MDEIVVKWQTGEMRLSKAFFTQSGAQVRKALKLMRDDMDWDAERAGELCDDLLAYQAELRKDAVERREYANALRAEAKEEHVKRQGRRVTRDNIYYALVGQAEEERGKAEELLRRADHAQSAVKLIQKTWGLEERA